jgi:hypothetical protein
LQVPIRGLIGIIFNGVSVWSLNNPPFIELVASIVARFFATIVDSLILRLSMTVRVTGVYGLAVAPAEGEIHRWSTMEAVEGNVCTIADRLAYVAVFRRPDLIVTGGDCGSFDDLRSNALLRAIAMDIGAYMDVSYRMHLKAPRFFAASALDVVTLVQAEYVDGRLKLIATTDHTLDEYQPILRAYFCCRMVPMRPGLSKADPYTVDIPCEFLPANASAIIVSNRGGRAERRILRLTT